MTQPSSVITDEMRALIGVEGEPRTYEVDKTGCRQFARAVGYTDLVYFDEEYAKSKGYRGIPAPPGFLGHMVYDPRNPPAQGAASLPFQSPLTRILNGGTDIEYFDTICAGDVLTATGAQVSDIQERQGRQGPMLIVNSRYTYKRGDQVAAIWRGTLIFY